MDAFQEVLHQCSSDRTSSLAEEFKTFRKYILLAMKSLQEQIALLARETDNLQMKSRRKILLIHGVPEAEREDTAASVVKIVVQKMQIAEFGVSDISRCHRLGRASSSSRARPILFKLSNLALRQKLWYGKTSLKGSGITLSEYLTKSRHDVFMAARERFGIAKCWTQDGNVTVLVTDSKRHRVYSIRELDKIEASVPSPHPATSVSPSLTQKKPDSVADKKLLNSRRRLAPKK